MSLWLPKWLRQDTPPEPEDVHRRYFIFAGAAAAAAALLPTVPDPNPWSALAGFDPAGRDEYMAFYRARMLHSVVRIDRAAIVQSIHDPGAFKRVCLKETEDALYEVYREAARNGIALQPADSTFYAEGVERAIRNHETEGVPTGREVIVPIVVHEVPRWEDLDGNVLREVRVPTPKLLPTSIRWRGDDDAT